jgi:hypothetical protein
MLKSKKQPFKNRFKHGSVWYFYLFHVQKYAKNVVRPEWHRMAPGAGQKWPLF